MKCRDLIKILEELSPPSFALSYDNSGLNIGSPEQEITRVLLAVDVTESVVEEAVKHKADMILTHHPLLFHKVSSITDEDTVGRKIRGVVKADITCYAMHTNFDVMGMADAAADRINLKEREVLEVTYEDEISKEGIGRVGVLPTNMTLRECAEMVKTAFDLPNVQCIGDENSCIVTAAISTGSGKSMVPFAQKAGADLLITGDIDYHTGLDAVAEGLCIIDAGHFGLEKIFIDYMVDFFQRELPSIDVIRSQQKENEYIV